MRLLYIDLNKLVGEDKVPLADDVLAIDHISFSKCYDKYYDTEANVPIMAYC